MPLNTGAMALRSPEVVRLVADFLALNGGGDGVDGGLSGIAAGDASVDEATRGGVGGEVNTKIGFEVEPRVLRSGLPWIL